MRIFLATAALVALAVPGNARDRSRDRAPAATPAGAPKSCIPLRSIRESRVRDDRTIDFIMSGRTTYRNVLPYGCPGLGFQQSFSYATSLSDLCSTDIITVLYTSPGVQRGASCGLGQFQPVTLAAK